MQVSAITPFTKKASSLEALIEFQSQGRYWFKSEEFAHRCGREPGSLANKAALNRLVSAGRIVCLRKQPSTWLLLPLDKPGQGITDKTLWLDSFLEQEDPTYYLGLSSAARYWGSSQFGPGVEQVVGAKIKRDLSLSGLKIQFFHKLDAQKTPTVRIPVQSGGFRVSTPEATMLDLIRHAHDIGGSEILISVFCDLAGQFTASGWEQALDAMDNAACAQRAGFLLDQLGFEPLAQQTQEWIGERRTNLIVFGPQVTQSTPYIHERFRVRYGEAEKEIVGLP